jgi:tetratricopeptide (TPR) repeat protein
VEGDESAVTSNSVSGGHFHGPVLQAGSISIDTLTVAPRTRPRPRQIPVPNSGFVFVNRKAELLELRQSTAETAGAGPARIVVVSGLGGVGKTQLVTHWASQQPDFTDGQLYADLADVRHDGGVDVGGVLGTWLRALGEDESEIGGSLSERAANFRTRTAGLRLLAVVDNAQQAAEIRPLVPAAGVLVVTSRRPLPGLTMDGAHPVTVGPLTAESGVELFRGWLDEERGKHPALAELVALCDGLPLALRAVGSRLLDRPRHSVADVAAELADEQRRLEIMEGEQAAMSAALDAAYESLPEHSREALRVMGVFPGTTFTAELLEAAGVLRPDDALAALLAGQLATEVGGERAEQTGPRRYRLHDLVRLHARRRAAEEVPEAERQQLLCGFVDFYRERAASADVAVLGPRFRLSELPVPPHFTDSATALEWLDAERSNLLAVLRSAHSEGSYDAVWRLCESLWALYHSRKHVGDWIDSHRLGIEAAQWESRPDVETRLRNQLARAYMETGEHEMAEAELGRAAGLLGLLTEPRLPGMIWETQGLLRLARHQPEQAIALFTDARDANERSRDNHGVVVQSYNLGQALAQAGRPREAERVLMEALALAIRTFDDPMRSRIGIVQGQVQRALGQPEEAVRQTVNAAHWAARLGQRVKLDQALTSLLELAGEVEDPELGAAWRRQIETLRQRAGASEADG